MAAGRRTKSTESKELPRSGKRIAQVKAVTAVKQQNRNKQVFICPQCGKRCNERSTFNQHMGMHEGRHKCSYCGKACPSNYNRKRHEASHTGERAFKCDVCQRGFIQRSDLVNHSCSAPARRRYTLKDDVIVVSSVHKSDDVKKLEAENKKLREELDKTAKMCEELAHKLSMLELELNPATIFKKEDPHQESEGLATEQELPTSDDTVTDQDEHSDHRMSMDLMEEQEHSTSFTPTTDEEEVYITNDDLGLPRKRCVFCWKDTHLADDCRRYSHVPDRWTLRTRFLLCAVCLTLHPNKPCPADLVSPCTYCKKDDHHNSLCRSDRHQQFLKELKMNN